MKKNQAKATLPVVAAMAASRRAYVHQLMMEPQFTAEDQKVVQDLVKWWVDRRPQHHARDADPDTDRALLLALAARANLTTEQEDRLDEMLDRLTAHVAVARRWEPKPDDHTWHVRRVWCERVLINLGIALKDNVPPRLATA